MRKTGLYGSAYCFSADHNPIAVVDMLDIHNYLYKNMSYKSNIWIYYKFLFTAIAFFSFNVLSANSLKCITIKNQECRVRPKIINNDLFYPFSIKVSKCSGNCNSISDPYFKERVPDVIKNMNLKVFNMSSWSNETKQIKWHKSCKYECKLNSSVCNNKQKWNKDKCKCECNKINRCDKEFI